MEELQRTRHVDWLPRAGALLFFYDVDNQPWGFDPADEGSCAILHVPDLEAPSAVTLEAGKDECFPRMNLEFREISTFPSTERPAVIALALSDEEREEYWQVLDASFQGLPKHQLIGLPSPVQGDDMELECQLASNGLYCGDSSGYNNPRARQLEAGAQSWRLLLQLDTDDDAGMMWGDCGMLYFWVRVEDTAAGNFQNPWFILQCA
jgi:uncharacterized protein YwqG